MHEVVEPTVLYFGTPVVLVSSLNEDGSPNLAPISSAWWLGWSCVLGFGPRSQTAANLAERRECVLNLPSVEMVSAVDQLARTTASDPVPPYKLRMGYRHESDKFALAGFTPIASDIVGPPRVADCPVQLEGLVRTAHRLPSDEPADGRLLTAIEVRIVRVHVDERLLMEGDKNRIDPDRWRPLIMSFSEFYGLGAKVHASRLASIPESLYRVPQGGTTPVANERP